MLLTVTGKHLDVGDSLRQHAETALGGVVERYFGKAIEGHLVLSREAHLFRAELSVHLRRDLVVQGQGDAGDAYAAVDAAIGRVERRVRRYKSRLRDDHKRPRESEAERLLARGYVLAAEPEEHEAEEPAGPGEPVIVAEMALEIPLVTVGEAVMRMTLADLPSFVFRNSAHGGLNVVYRRSDGNIGWVDPDLAAPGQKRAGS